MLEVPNAVAIELVSETSFAPLFDNVITPVKLLLPPLVLKSIACAPALKLEVPGTVNAPVCDIAPFVETIVKFLPTLDAASDVAILFVKVTSFVPLFDSVIAPVKLLLPPLVLKSIPCAPALKLEVPGTVIVPVCDIAPPAVAIKLPPLVKVTAGNAIAALSKYKVKLRKLVKPLKLGTLAPLLTFRMDTSRILLFVPPKTNADVPKSFNCEPNKISELAAVTATVVVPPVTVITPLSLILPPEVTLKF